MDQAFLYSCWVFFFQKKILFMYLRKRERERKQGGRGEGEGETDSPLSREPNAVLDPRTLG